MLEVKKTTYKVDGSKEPCFEITDGYTMVRIAPYYHYIGKTTILITQYLGDSFHSQEEWDYEWDYLTKKDALEISKKYSVYLKCE